MLFTHKRIILIVTLLLVIFPAIGQAKLGYNDDRMDLNKPVVMGVDLTKFLRPKFIHEIYAVTVIALPSYLSMNNDILPLYTHSNDTYVTIGGLEYGFGAGYTCELLDFNTIKVALTATLFWQSGQSGSTPYANISFTTISGLFEINPIWHFPEGIDLAASVGVYNQLYIVTGSFLAGPPLLSYQLAGYIGGYISKKVGSLRLRLKLGVPLGPDPIGLYSEFGVGVRFSI